MRDSISGQAAGRVICVANPTRTTFIYAVSRSQLSCERIVSIAFGEAMKWVVKVALLATSLAAAVCWYRAATAKAPEASGDEPWTGGAFSEKKGNQMLADSALQARWNTRAASFATVAAIFTAIDAFL
jgi:hypothetical protein